MIINGPIGYFKLKKGNKTICLFADVHVLLDNIHKDGIDVDVFMQDYLKNNKQTVVDIMLEEHHMVNIEYDVTIYLTKISKMLKKMYDEEPNNKIRIHYVDVRNEKNKIIEKIDEIINTKEINYHKLKKILKCLKHDKKAMEHKKNIYNKILNKYNLENVKKIINSIFLKQCYNKTKYVINKLFKIKKRWIHINKYKNITIDYDDDEKEYSKYYIKRQKIDLLLLNEISIVKEHVEIINMFYMDCYFLRRFLDKIYVERCIMYAGLMHILNYIYVLINKFDYELIEIDYNDYEKHNFLNIIKNMKNIYDTNIFIDESNMKYKQYITLNTMF